jgi:RNA polymerase sigma factor (sigma-70 family)
VRGENLITEKGNPESWQIDIEAYYLRYGPMVLRRCRQMLKDEQSAHDAMQEVFLRVLTNQDRLTGMYPSALLYRIATNICLNRIRNERKHTVSEYLDILHNTSFFEEQGGSDSAKKLLEYVLQREKEAIRKLAVMYFINGMTIKEIAETTKLSVSGVHKKLEKLRRKIKQKGEVS